MLGGPPEWRDVIDGGRDVDGVIPCGDGPLWPKLGPLLELCGLIVGGREVDGEIERVDGPP